MSSITINPRHYSNKPFKKDQKGQKTLSQIKRELENHHPAKGPCPPVGKPKVFSSSFCKSEPIVFDETLEDRPGELVIDSFFEEAPEGLDYLDLQNMKKFKVAKSAKSDFYAARKAA